MNALVVVDLQKDFCPGGSLAVPKGDEIVKTVNELLPNFNLVIFTKDWHTPDNIGFASQHPGLAPFDRTPEGDTVWPDHCVQDSEGAELHDGINMNLINKDFYIFKKGYESDSHPYSAFGGFDAEIEPEFKEFLDSKNVTDLYICGLAGDYCCAKTAIDAALYGYRSIFIKDATRFIGEEDETMKELAEAGVEIVETWNLPLIRCS